MFQNYSAVSTAAGYYAMAAHSNNSIGTEILLYFDDLFWQKKTTTRFTKN